MTNLDANVAAIFTCTYCGADIFDVGGRKNVCWSCLKKYEDSKTDEEKRGCQIKKDYNLDYRDYIKMYEEQGGKCAICQSCIAAYNDGTGIRVACVDHDHDTGRVRGLLCGRCNSVLGFSKENTGILLSACGYLKKHND